MSKDQDAGKSEDGTALNREGLKRRDLLLSGTSLVAASALSGVGSCERLRKRSNQQRRRRRANSRTSSSSWATTSACGISAPTTAA